MSIPLNRFVAGVIGSFLLAFTAVPVLQAVVLPDDIANELEHLANEFLLQEGFELVDDIDSFTGEEWYTDERFPQWNTQSIFLPDSEMTPVQKAVMLVEHLEGALPHVRYLVTFRSVFAFRDDYSAPPQAHISVTRFNLGPDYRKDLAQYIDEEYLASEEAFGIGPAVSWRFVFTPVQGQNAYPVLVSRKIMSTDDAAAMTCFDIHCMSLALPEGPEAGLEEIGAPEHDMTVYEAGAILPYNSEMGHVAGVLGQLALGSSGYGEPVEGLLAGESPVTLVLSSGTGGQEPVAAGLLHETHLMDDAIAQMWHARLQWGDNIFWMRHIVYRPGRS